MPRPVPPLTPELLATYERNIIRIDLPAGPVRLVPSDADSTDAPPHPEPVYLVAVWNPFGRPSSAAENQRWAEAIEEFDGTIDGYLPAVVHDAELRWVEGAVAVQGDEPSGPQVVAEQYGQPALFRWDSEGVTVLRTEDMAVVHRWHVLSEELAMRPCVMEPGPHEEPCKRRGGPWTGRSISASHEWELDYAARLAAFGGCDICHGDARGPGGPIGLVELSLPSRWTSERIVLGPL